MANDPLGTSRLFRCVGFRSVVYGLQEDVPRCDGRVLNATLASRPVIYDRNGQPLAFDIRVLSLFAAPRHIFEVKEAVEAINSVLPAMDAAAVAFKW